MKEKRISRFLIGLLIGLFSCPTWCLSITISAGNNVSVCLGSTVTIGGSPTASGGTAPYTYSWAPAAGLNNTTSSNPTATPSTNTQYTVFVIDAAFNSGSSTVNVLLHAQSFASAGLSQSICEGDTVTLGGNNLTAGGAIYNWSPGLGLSSATATNPLAFPLTTTTYTLTVTGPNCPPNITFVTVTVHPLPIANAGTDVTILSGQSTMLNGSGGSIYWWSPATSLNYQTIQNPDADPTYTITYFLAVSDQYGCISYDNVTVTVEPSDSLFIYNTFTPNGDADNDNWYIGNIDKFPDNTLTVYNRNGRIVYNAHPYTNNWHGKTSGEELPCATYYYILDKGNGDPVVHGAVTLLR